ncbi:hypothetical protein L0222_22280 [bacterium]|nr:hypothetical protein [bacterium]MCI0605535.1 hypothetical protein [bacterium]
MTQFKRATIGILILAGILFTGIASSEPPPERFEALPLAWVEPKGVVKITECFPHQGEHFAKLKDLEQFPVGPIYTVYNGQLTSIEYVFAKEDLEKQSSWKNLKFIYHGREVPIQHMDVDYLPDIFPVETYAIHFYVITHGAERSIECN